MLFSQLDSIYVFASGNWMMSCGCYAFSQRRVMLAAGAINSALALAALLPLNYDAKLSSSTSLMAGANAVLHYYLHCLKMNYCTPPMYQRCFYYASAAISTLMLVELADHFQEHFFQIEMLE